jgi:hypothetical protein
MNMWLWSTRWVNSKLVDLVFTPFSSLGNGFASDGGQASSHIFLSEWMQLSSHPTLPVPPLAETHEIHRFSPKGNRGYPPAFAFSQVAMLDTLLRELTRRTERRTSFQFSIVPMFMNSHPHPKLLPSSIARQVCLVVKFVDKTIWQPPCQQHGGFQITVINLASPTLPNSKFTPV